MDDTLRSAWRANARVNRVLLEHLDEAMLAAQTPGGGYTVAQHLAHLVGSLKYWTWRADRAMGEALPDLGDPDADDFVAVADPDRTRAVMQQAAEAALAAAEQGRGDQPHESAGMFLVHMLVHEAHHRGQILLALKGAGHPLPDEAAMWGPWKGR